MHYKNMFIPVACQCTFDAFSDQVSIRPQHPIIWDPLEKNVATTTLRVNQIDKC